MKPSFCITQHAALWPFNQNTVSRKEDKYQINLVYKEIGNGEKLSSFPEQLSPSSSCPFLGSIPGSGDAQQQH